MSDAEKSERRGYLIDKSFLEGLTADEVKELKELDDWSENQRVNFFLSALKEGNDE